MDYRMSYLKPAHVPAAKHGFIRMNTCPMIACTLAIHKKRDPAVCANYRGINILNIAYKVVSTIMCGRLKPIVNNMIGSYQRGFRLDKSTIDQIYTIESWRRLSTNKSTPITFLSISKPLSTALMIWHPCKTRLCRMTLSTTLTSIKIGKDLSKLFDIRRGFKRIIEWIKLSGYKLELFCSNLYWLIRFGLLFFSQMTTNFQTGFWKLFCNCNNQCSGGLFT